MHLQIEMTPFQIEQNNPSHPTYTPNNPEFAWEYVYLSVRDESRQNR